MFIIDSHTHLHFEHFNDDLSRVLDNAKAAGVQKMISIGTDVQSSLQSIAIADRFPELVIAAAGIHPTECLQADESDFQKISELLLKNSALVAVGEVGLDLYWRDVPLGQQLMVFEAMQSISETVHKPMIIHNRDALPEMRDYFADHPLKNDLPGVMHSFAGSVDDARFFLDLGFYISFTGVVTFKNFKQQEVVKFVPVNRLLLETDSPFLAPVPHRGKRNEPSFLIHTLKKIAELKEMDHDQLADMTYRNTIDLFNLKSG